jgi:hypothetical protein
MNKNVSITCRPVRFYSEWDADLFFHWLKALPSLTSVEEKEGEVLLDFEVDALSESELNDLKALFKRYGYENVEQLQALDSLS